MDRDKLAKMAGAVRTGGKGTVRRKKKAIHKTTTTDDKRLQNTLKKLGVNTIPGIEEVNIFKDDSEVVHFQNPKVQASIAANTYVISGPSQTKKLQDLLPGILNQMGPDSIQHLKKMMQQLTGGMGMPGLNSMGVPGSFPGIQSAPEGQDAEDDDALAVPHGTVKPVTRTLAAGSTMCLTWLRTLRMQPRHEAQQGGEATQVAQGMGDTLRVCSAHLVGGTTMTEHLS
ncbi:hypothetical protein QJQ45_028073 [Haematococcus lacustris]|nr:hypothetical protein QJQ45_028073 [Haematococcus lacustris]